jgi:hypothetical protein
MSELVTMSNSFEYRIIVNKEIHNPKLFADVFDMLAANIEIQIKSGNRDPDWRVVFPYKDVYFDIWEAANGSNNGIRYIIITIVKSLVSTHLLFTRSACPADFWDQFPNILKEIMNTMLITEVQST